MKTVSALTALIGLSLSGTAFAQLSTLPADSSTDFSNSPHSKGSNAGASHWDSPTGIKPYWDQSYNHNGAVYLTGSWSSSAPSAVTSAWSTVQSDGGSIRAIFTGETAGWKNDFGYTYDKSPVTDSANSYTVWKSIDSQHGVAGTSNPAFGDYVDVSFLPKDPAATNFDFWLNAGKGSSTGGVDTVLHPWNSTPSQNHVKWLSSPIVLNTWVASAGKYEDVNTYLFALEDWNLNDKAHNDYDYSDLIIAVQLFGANGTPLGGNPVPEASTYGLVGAAGLLGLAALRRRKAAQAKA
jgi:MYXO-CTERM domain-containing protein